MHHTKSKDVYDFDSDSHISEDGGKLDATTDDIELGNDGDSTSYYISRQALRTAIKHTEMGFGLVDDTKFFSNEEEK